MYKIYFKQAVQMLKQNRFISIVAIIGTALALMMIMAILVSEEVKNISVAPEVNRDRTYYVTYQTKSDTVNHRMEAGYVAYDIMRQYLVGMKTPECVSIVNTPFAWNLTLINKEGESNYINTTVRITDANYWRIMAFSFIEGKPFAQEEYESGMPVAVISQSTARKLFKGEKAIGQTIMVKFKPYRVIGIVKDVSPVFNMAYGHVWIPITSRKRQTGDSGYHVLLLVQDNDDYPALYEEVRKIEQAYQTQNPPWTLYLRGPENHRVFRMDNIRGINATAIANMIKIQERKMVFILLILLMVPAINLSGFSLSRIKKRTAEIGVRKAFGAKRHVILAQVLCENLITSLIGGVIGLFLSYLVVFLMRRWLLGIPSGSEIPGSTLLSLPVFIAVFIVCMLINLLSAGIPAYRASRMKITDSLNQNDQAS